MDRRTVLKGGIILAATTHTAVLAPVVYDPLLDAINAYRMGVQEFAAIPEETLMSRGEGLTIDETYGPHQDRLHSWNTPALTKEGAVEAMKLMSDEKVFASGMGEAMHKAVLGFLENLAV